MYGLNMWYLKKRGDGQGMEGQLWRKNHVRYDILSSKRAIRYTIIETCNAIYSYSKRAIRYIFIETCDTVGSNRNISRYIRSRLPGPPKYPNPASTEKRWCAASCKILASNKWQATPLEVLRHGPKWAMVMTRHRRGKIPPEPNRTGLCWAIFFNWSIHPSIHLAGCVSCSLVLNWPGDVLLTNFHYVAETDFWARPLWAGKCKRTIRVFCRSNI